MLANELHETETLTPSFEAPGPGTWQQDPAHWPRPATPWTAEVFNSGFPRGFAESTRRYGVLLSHLEPAVIEGYVYYRAVPAADPGPRFEAAREALESRLWRADQRLWDEEFKPDSIRRNRRLQSVDVTSLSDADLARHLELCLENHEEMVYRHHKFNMAALLPVGLFVARAAAWTGLSNGELLGLLRGSSPVSNGTAADELRAVGEALREERLGPQSFAPDLPAGCVLELLAGRPGRVGETVRAYLDACGFHVASGYDVTDLSARELPDMLVNSFWKAAAAPEREVDRAEAAAGLRRVREAVPAEHRAEFDDLLAEARLVNHVRDERGLYNDLWAAGLSRRAIQEAGRRLTLRGRLDSDEQIFEASSREMIALLSGESRPTAVELAARARRRSSIPLAAVPPVLGDPPSAPPSLDGLPEPARTAAEAFGTALDEILGSSTEHHDERVVRGKAVSPGIHEGRARVISGPADFNRLEKGDVLVASSTSAAFNVVLPLLGAIVTDRGALLSHAAIVAREYGIPGVVGTREATSLVPDGAWVRVDGTHGTVEVLR